MTTSRTRPFVATMLLFTGAIAVPGHSSGGGQRTPPPTTPDIALLRSRLTLESRVHQQTGLTISQGMYGFWPRSEVPRDDGNPVGVERRFLDAGTVDRLDASCANDIKPARFQLTAGR